MKDDEQPDELPPAFKPFIASQALKPEFASAIAQTTKLRDLIPAFKPFIASDAMKAINAHNVVLSNLAKNYGAMSKLAETVKTADLLPRIAPETLKSMAFVARQVEQSRQAELNLSEIWSAQARRKANLEQAALDSADSMAALVRVAHNQETALESTAELVARLVQEQQALAEMERRASRINRRWLVLGIAIATISAIAGVVNLIVNWPR